MDRRHSDLDSRCPPWPRPIQIQDDDLMFEGKALSAWHEESRERLCRACLERMRAGRATGTQDYMDAWNGDPFTCTACTICR